ncbi:Aminopeptidase Y (Arg, Lys, Leu preference) [Microbacterium esteraromaticum]|uniref:Aminopeptidase Y (Arg, Lys, Leu preference) n=2 Tax=Microbacterium esteraromaticum TaxID=57043 RepID=A0A1R4KCG6_9MICO|nr:Aminopeptidase Y (Arg, Lys, Leu preference) [Microbacterium esteraromaticum]
MMPTAAHAAPYAPQDAIEAIETGTFLPSFELEFANKVSDANAYEHVRHLAVDIGPRVTGTAGEDAGLAYVQSVLDSYGMETRNETFRVGVSSFAMATSDRELPAGPNWQFGVASNAVFTGPDAPVTAGVVDVGNGADTTGFDLAGKFVLVDWVSSAAARNVLITALRGENPAGIIFTATADNASIPRLSSVPAAAQDILMMAAGTVQGERIRQVLESGPLELSITTDKSRDTGSNVIGVQKAAGDTDGTAPIIYIGAHIDSVIGSPGASDNGSGNGIMLEAARIFSEYSLNTEIRFGSWGGEEGGIRGSSHHANQLTADEIERSIGAWNTDMTGTSHVGTDERPFGFWGLSVNPDNADNAVLNFASATSVQAGYGDFNRGYVGRSDHQSFHDVGIPAAVFSWMYWSEADSIVLEPAYHKPSDTMEFISQERLGIGAEIIGASAFRAAMNTVDITVADEAGDPASGARVAMSCGADEGWRDAGVTTDEGTTSVLTPNTDCTFVALASNRANAFTVGEISGDTSIELALVLDTAAPVVGIATDIDPAVTGWFTDKPVTASVSATDDTDEAPVTEFSVNGGEWAPYTAPFALGDDGIYVVDTRATDGAGNVGAASEIVQIDTLAPELEVLTEGATRGNFTVRFYDETSGVERVEYRLPGGKWTGLGEDGTAEGGVWGTISQQLELDDEAVTVEFRAHDVAGNVSALATLEIGAVASTPGVSPDRETGQLAVTGANLPWLAGSIAMLLLAGGAIFTIRRNREGKLVADA